jgi:DNA gyrase subunit B
VDGGFIYIAQPPLYKIQRGKEMHYAFDDTEKFKILSDMGVSVDEGESSEEDSTEEEVETVKKSTKVRIQRYKGLGEMNAEELWETTMNPEFRISESRLLLRTG